MSGEGDMDRVARVSDAIRASMARHGDRERTRGGQDRCDCGKWTPDLYGHIYEMAAMGALDVIDVAALKLEQVEPEEAEWNGRTCPYYARYFSLPGHDPNAVCEGGCDDEPSCITDEPLGGWPALTDHPPSDDLLAALERSLRPDEAP